MSVSEHKSLFNYKTNASPAESVAVNVELDTGVDTVAKVDDVDAVAATEPEDPTNYIPIGVRPLEPLGKA